jgi:hypothetical protein
MFNSLYFILLFGLWVFGSLGALHAEPAKHLFILSGQSNMTGALKAGFAEKVEKHFGKEHVVIAHKNKPGRGIRFWDKDYVFPDQYTTPGKTGAPSEASRAQHGMEYPPLLEAVQKAGDAGSFATITLVWMQGESDGGRELGSVYAQSFKRVLNRLTKDLGREDISFVIGRISDAQVGKEKEAGWQKVREVQMALGDEAEFGAWIDTDDLNGPDNLVHYPATQYPVLGARFADKAIELVTKRLKAAPQ